MVSKKNKQCGKNKNTTNEVQLKTAGHGNKNGHRVTNFPKLLFPLIPAHQKQQPEKIWDNNGSFNHINNWVAYDGLYQHSFK